MFLKGVRDILTGGGDDLARDAGNYWEMSDVNERIRDQSHWFGEGRWGRERWLAYGDFFFDLAGKRLREVAGWGWLESLTEKTALEWGCGGGAIIRSLCARFGLVYGLDISEATLRECRKRVREFSGRGRSGEPKAGNGDHGADATAAGIGAEQAPVEIGKFQTLHIPAESPEAVLLQIAPASVDFIISIGVFKHFPSQAYTGRVLQVMATLLNQDGFLFVQIRYFDGEEKYRSKDRDYARNVITMTSFTAAEFARQAKSAGLTILHRERDGDGEEERHEYYLLGR